MTIINGTAVADTIDNLENGDFDIFGFGGDDFITVKRQSPYTGKITVDGGPGRDTFNIQVNSQDVVVHGGEGDDTFWIDGGGTYYGDEGADSYRIFSSSPSDRVPAIIDLTAQDRINLVDLLKSQTTWVMGTNPVDAGVLNFTQVGNDVLVRAFIAGARWESLVLIKNTNFSSLTTDQFGFQPKLIPFPTVVASASEFVAEGRDVTLNFSLEVAAPQDITVVISYKATGSGPDRTGNTTFTIKAGEKQASYTVSSLDDFSTGDTKYDFDVSVTPAVYFSNQSNKHVIVTLKDNDSSGFTVGHSSVDFMYEYFTLRNTMLSADREVLTPQWQTIEQAHTRDAVRILETFALSTTTVALTSYQFFTGKSPGAPGLKYLVNSPDNTSDLNDAGGMYAGMNTENRYINFAANLGLAGEGKGAFAAAYGGLTFRQAVEKAYDAIIGKSYAQAAGINVQAAIDGVVATAGYFDALASERMGGFDHDLAMKAGMIGYLLVEGQKAHVGVYARAVENFYLDLTDNAAQHNVDLVAIYGPGTFLDTV